MNQEQEQAPGSGGAPSPRAAEGERRPSLSQIFLEFLRLGATAFGGPAMVAHVRGMVVQRHRWVDEETFRSGLALCQAIPGATAMQTCAYIGLRLRGVRGAVASYLGFGFPAFLLMLTLSILYRRFSALPAVVATFDGLRALIAALIAQATFTFGRSYLKRWQDFLLAPIAAALFWFGVSPILVIPLCGVLGAALAYRQGDMASASGLKPSPFPVRPLAIILGSVAVLLVALFFLGRGIFSLSLLMMKIDLFAFGGGFASIPLMLHEVVDVRHWMDAKTFMDGIALGQITPGPIVITSTFVGYVLQGIGGGVVATASIFLPSFILVVVTSPFFSRLNSFPLFRKAVQGILCSFVGLLLSTAVRFGFSVGWDVPRLALAVLAFGALLLRVDLLWVVLGGIVYSVILH